MENYTLYADKELFLLISEGDEAAFGHLFNRYIEILHPFITTFTKSTVATREMIQETFIRVWLNRDKLSSIENPRAWIFTIASRECIAGLRKKLADQKLVQNLAKEVAPPEDATSQRLGLKELQQMIHEAVEQFPPQRKRIYYMSREQGMKIRDIAQALDISPNTVKNVLVTCLKAIREYLESKGYLLGALLCLFLRNK